MTRFVWFGTLLYGFARLIGLLPMAVLRDLGAAFGGLAYRLDSRETRIARRNLALIHPQADAGLRETQTRELMQSMGQSLMETLAIWTRPRARVLRLVQQVHGETHLQTALAHGRHLADHRNEALLVHPLEQLQGLEAVAHGVLP